ncbi:MAG: hypothetical protein R2939_07920 [Kofleriaceae bacterium]
MRATSLLTFVAASSLLVAAGCVAEDAVGDGDGEHDAGIGAGKADGDTFSECELGKVVEWLNGGASADDLLAAGVHGRAVTNLLAHRDGADGEFGTADDDLFDDAEEVDDVSWVGPQAFRALVAAVADQCVVEPADIYAQARDVDRHKITFPERAAAPTDYEYPDGGQFDLNGTEFWQKWSGGLNPTYDFEEGTEFGRRCLQASAIRFETIMADPPAELVSLAADTNWDGSFFNWNDDYSMGTRDGSSASLWAWRTYLIKWISQTNRDGSCYLPTLDMVKSAARDCARTAANANGEIQGCRS